MSNGIFTTDDSGGSFGGRLSSGSSSGAGMSTVISQQFDADSKDATLYESDTWTEITAVIDGAAGGSNELFFASSKFQLVAGESVRFTMSPKTILKFTTDSGAPVRVDLIATELTYIEEMLNCVDALGQLIRLLGGLPRVA